MESKLLVSPFNMLYASLQVYTDT